MRDDEGATDVELTRRHAVARRSGWAPVLIVVLVLGVAAVALWRSHALDAPVPAAASPVAQAPAPAAVVPTPEEAPPANPAPQDADAALRALGARLSTSADLAGWLAQANIVQRLTAAVNMVANGESPRAPLSFLGLGGDFSAAAAPDGTSLMTARTHARFDTFVRVLTGVDARRAGQAYAEVAPFFRAAFRGIARPGASFDAALHAAISRLLGAPVLAHEPALHDKGLQMVFVDPALEALPPVQKLMLRMGPENERALQAWLGTFEKALPTSPR